jgi:hypothetical protein
MKSRLAFSNGTEFDIWQNSWCRNCTKDAAARRGDFENGCVIIATAMFSEGDIPEWSEDAEKVAQGVWPRVICSEFDATKEGE